jgi:PIN domain nuclease of toxin-antitoxin system
LTFEPERVPERLRGALDEADERYFSAASAWEIAIKSSIGKLSLPIDAGSFVSSRMANLFLQPLPITQRYMTTVQMLPFHHRDPFDRLLIAQALVEDLTILSVDRIFSSYAARVF